MKIYKIITLNLLLFFMATSVALAQEYKITNFVSEIDIQKDRTIKVTETINADFLAQKRGIFRYVPIAYRSEDRTINSRFSLVTVLRDGQNEERKVEKQGDNMMIRIGDPDVYLTGKHTYTVVYEMQNIIQDYGDNEELYWNISGNDWDTQILRREAVVRTPYAHITDYTCYPQDECRVKTSEGVITFTQMPNTNVDDLTIVVALDKNNQFVPVAASTKLKNTISDYVIYIFVLLPALVMGYLWFQRGRDKKFVGDNVYYEPENASTESVSPFHRAQLPMVYYPIDGLTPAQVGTIVDEKVDISDISAEIIELARLGYIKIDVKKSGRNDEYLLYQTDKTDTKDLKEYQSYLLDKLFEDENTFHSLKKLKKIFKKDEVAHLQAIKNVEEGKLTVLSAQKDTFYIYLDKFKKKLYKNMKDEGYFRGDPQKSRESAIGILVVVYFIGFMGIGFLSNLVINPLLPFFVGAVGFVASLFFALQMPSRTAKGYALKEQIRGLKFYIKKGKWRHEIAERNLFFEQMLPLAIALGVADKFAKQMQELNIKAQPTYINAYNSYNYNSLSKIDNKFSEGLMAGAPKSSQSSWSDGSGFSGGGGGGFGGGGGGSW